MHLVKYVDALRFIQLSGALEILSDKFSDAKSSFKIYAFYEIMHENSIS